MNGKMVRLVSVALAAGLAVAVPGARGDVLVSYDFENGMTRRAMDLMAS